jgi:hypothetical protein
MLATDSQEKDKQDIECHWTRFSVMCKVNMEMAKRADNLDNKYAQWLVLYTSMITQLCTLSLKGEMNTISQKLISAHLHCQGLVSGCYLLHTSMYVYFLCRGLILGQNKLSQELNTWSLSSQELVSLFYYSQSSES